MFVLKVVLFLPPVCFSVKFKIILSASLKFLLNFTSHKLTWKQLTYIHLRLPKMKYFMHFHLFKVCFISIWKLFCLSSSCSICPYHIKFALAILTSFCYLSSNFCKTTGFLLAYRRAIDFCQFVCNWQHHEVLFWVPVGLYLLVLGFSGGQASNLQNIVILTYIFHYLCILVLKF